MLPAPAAISGGGPVTPALRFVPASGGGARGSPLRCRRQAPRRRRRVRQRPGCRRAGSPSTRFPAIAHRFRPALRLVPRPGSDPATNAAAGVQWLRDHGYRYLVVSRERHRQFDAEAAVSLRTRSNQTVHLHKVVSTDPDEVRLYCYSEERAKKERAIVERFAARFEAALTRLHEGLARPRAHKRLDQVWQRIGRLKTKHPRVASHYQIGVTADETQVRARPAPHLPPQAAAGRRPPVHHRHRLPARTGHPNPTARARQRRRLDHVAPHSGRAATRHRHLPAPRRTHAARAHGHASRTRAARNLRRARHRPASRGVRKTLI